jgi:hypothetical protein
MLLWGTTLTVKIAIAAVGRTDGLLDYNRIRAGE